jgi:amidase
MTWNKAMSIPEYGELDGLAMAALVNAGEVSALELVEEAIRRIEMLNPQLNAVTYPMFDLARTAAEQPAAGTFAGVPFVLKDMTAQYAGTPTTHGSRLFANVPNSSYDSEIVKRFKRAGLLCVGKTNTPELALAGTTEPLLRGATHNPWDLGCTTGGSSGGSAAAVAARIVPIGHGGDGGGSLRMPASCCGLVGVKPSRMRTPHGPDLSAVWESCCGEFVMSRSVRDSAWLLDEVAGQDVGAFYSAPAQERPFRDEIERDPGRLRIAWSARGPDNIATHPDCVAAVEHAAKLCADLGHDVEENCPHLDDELNASFAEAFLGAIAIETARDADEMAELIGRPATPDDIEPANWSFIEHGRSFSGVDAVRFRRILHRIARAVGPFFEDYDVYISPTLAKPPVPLGVIDTTCADWSEFFGAMFEFMPFTSLFNVTGAAGVSLPLWWNAQGLPIGCQFISRMGRDGLILALAAQIERAAPWSHRRPAVSA